MSLDTKKSNACFICHKQKPKADFLPIELIAEPLSAFIKERFPELTSQKSICVSCLNHLRTQFVQNLLSKEKGELSELETGVINSLYSQVLLSKDINQEFNQKQTFGQRVADKVAEFGGSWTFIFIFVGILVSWIILNSVKLLHPPFDPYPYILLNLVLSCIAAIQAPIIMMSQNRHSERDRIKADQDYQTNLKAELEIRQLNLKVDQLLTNHWQRLIEIQQIQTEMMEEIVRRKRLNNKID